MTTQDAMVRPSVDSRRIATTGWSLVVPMYDEEQNVDPLLEELVALPEDARPTEILIVDDASKDGTAAALAVWKSLTSAAKHEGDGDAPRRVAPGLRLRLLRLSERAGQSAAVLAGVRHASHPIVGIIDGDLQNDPADLAAMVAQVAAAEIDAVFGVRANRNDGWVRRLSSKVGNGFRNVVTGDRVHDAGCGTKVLRRELFLSLPQFVGMHRFMPTLCRYEGARIAQTEVRHRPRVAGRTKYGIVNRAWRGMVDCFGVRWLRSRRLSPSVAQER